MVTGIKPIKNVVSDWQGSTCTLLATSTGRWNDRILKPPKDPKSGTDQLCYGYQLAAYIYFGRDALMLVPTNKKATDLTISHICGVEYCCTLGHTRLEPKKVNDERTHCQYCLANILRKTQDVESVVKFWDIGGCNHYPFCFDVKTAIEMPTTTYNKYT